MTEKPTKPTEQPGPEADFVKCGAGRGAECCKFLLAGPDGAECGRFGSLDNLLRSRPMIAARIPAEPFPLCQLEACNERD